MGGLILVPHKVSYVRMWRYWPVVQLSILLGVRGSVSESRDQIPPLPPFVTKASAVEFLQSSISAAAAPAVSAVSDYLQISPLPKCRLVNPTLSSSSHFMFHQKVVVSTGD